MDLWTAFHNKAGFALIRRPSWSGTWEFVRWVDIGTDVTMDQPGPGTWVYQIVAAIGANHPGNIQSVGFTGQQVSITTLEAKR